MTNERHHLSRTLRALTLYNIVTFLVGVSLGGGLGYVLSSDTVVVRQGTPNTPAAITSVNLMIVDGDDVKTWNTVDWHETMTPLELLQKVGGASGFSIKVDKDATGAPIVTSVGTGKEDGIPWRYFVNNTEPPRPADGYSLKPGDIVVWVHAKK